MADVFLIIKIYIILYINNKLPELPIDPNAIEALEKEF